MMEHMNRFTVEWQNFCVSANPKVNPGPKDRERVLCGGWAPIYAEDRNAAFAQYQETFPEDRIISISP